jgi:hypothetical protein
MLNIPDIFQHYDFNEELFAAILHKDMGSLAYVLENRQLRSLSVTWLAVNVAVLLGNSQAAILLLQWAKELANIKLSQERKEKD